MKKLTLMLIIFVLITPSFAANESNIQITKLDGGEVYGAKYFGKRVSSLHTTVIVLNDSSCPIKINETNVKGSYYDRSYSFGNSGSVSASEIVSAYEIRYMLYDMFNDHIKTLSYTDVKDIKPGDSVILNASWYATYNQVNDLLTIIAFVGNVRNEDGKVWRYDEKAITNELVKLVISANAEELNPNKDK